MNKKKIQSLLVAGALSIGIIGGSLAWFTSQDNVTNIFKTGSSTIPDIKAGIDVQEKLDRNGNGLIDPEEDKYITDTENTISKPIVPGDKIIKQVKVVSDVDYDQYVRATIKTEWYAPNEMLSKEYVGEKGEKVSEVRYYREKLGGEYEYSNSQAGRGWLPLDANLVLDIDNESWTAKQKDEKYYYKKVLAAEGETPDLLKSVTLKGEAGNMYKNLTFNVRVDADSIQVENGAAADQGWEVIPFTDINK